MLRYCIIGCVILTGFSTSKPDYRVDRLYWDHVEGFCLADTVGREIYAGSRNRLYYSSDFGATWSHCGDLPKLTLIRQIVPIDRGTIFIIASKGIYGESFLSTDSGHSFCPSLASTGAGNCAYFDRPANTLYTAAEKPFKLMRSTDSGYSWKPIGNKLDTLRDPHVCSLLVDSDANGKIFYVSVSSPAIIYEKREAERSWHICFVDPIKNSYRELPLVTKWGNKLVACLTSMHSPKEKIYISDDRAISWRGVDCPFGIWGAGVNATDTSTLWIGNYGAYAESDDSASLEYTQNDGKSWTPIPNCKGKFFWQLEELPNRTLFAATDFGLLRVHRN